MPNYLYTCEKCNNVYEIRHEMSCEDEYECPDCEGSVLIRKPCAGFYIAGSIKPTLEDIREENHKKKVKDPERAYKSRKYFGDDGPTNVRDEPDPMRVIKRGKTLGGQQMEVEKKDLVKALAKDSYAVQKSIEILKKTSK